MSEFLDQMRLEADPVADEVVARIVAEQGADEAKKLFTLLIHNVDIPFDRVPGYVRAYMEDNAQLPEHFDLSRIRRGQQVFVDEGLIFCVFLFFKSLPTCYLDWRGAQVLYLTGRLDQGRQYPAIFARRIAETIQFVLDCMAPGSLDPGGKARQTILKVRLIHASIRHFVQQRPEWNGPEWGMPINQEDMALTLQTFGTTMVMGMEQLQNPLSAERAGDFHYAWQAVGHLLGLRSDLNPGDLDAGRRLLGQILDRNAGDSEAGRSLTAALIDYGEDLIPGKTFDFNSRALVAYFLGPQHAALMGLQADGCLTRLLPAFLGKLIGWGNKLEEKNALSEMVANRLGLGIIKALQRRMNSYKGIQLVLPEAMQDAWGA